MTDIAIDHLSSSSTEISMDVVAGRKYMARGVKGSYEVDPISLEPERNIYRRTKDAAAKRDFHWLLTSQWVFEAEKLQVRALHGRLPLPRCLEVSRLSLCRRSSKLISDWFGRTDRKALSIFTRRITLSFRKGNDEKNRQNQ